ncbi:hypothetical protein DID75_03575 [Candidatus Marinamargulisbacteria bacterium SCGC AG-410-N11]|nr:hypothetical protein DID75_03575 [Candidatus Marinamargulisbacteria bacterium SCGC AG-410-N11]
MKNLRNYKLISIDSRLNLNSENIINGRVDKMAYQRSPSMNYSWNYRNNTDEFIRLADHALNYIKSSTNDSNELQFTLSTLSYACNHLIKSKLHPITYVKYIISLGQGYSNINNWDCAAFNFEKAYSLLSEMPYYVSEHKDINQRLFFVCRKSGDINRIIRTTLNHIHKLYQHVNVKKRGCLFMYDYSIELYLYEILDYQSKLAWLYSLKNDKYNELNALLNNRNLLEKNKMSSNLKAICYRHLGFYFSRINKIESANFYFEKSINLLKHSSDEKSRTEELMVANSLLSLNTKKIGII